MRSLMALSLTLAVLELGPRELEGAALRGNVRTDAGAGNRVRGEAPGEVPARQHSAGPVLLGFGIAVRRRPGEGELAHGVELALEARSRVRPRAGRAERGDGEEDRALEFRR